MKYVRLRHALMESLSVCRVTVLGLRGWSLTSLFSTNTAMSEWKGQGRKVILLPSEGRLAIYLPQPWPLFCSAATQKRESTYLNYYGSAYNRGRQLLHRKTKLSQIQQNTRKFLTILTKRYTTPQPFYGPFFPGPPG